MFVSSIDNNNNGGEDYDRPNGRCSFKKNELHNITLVFLVLFEVGIRDRCFSLVGYLCVFSCIVRTIHFDSNVTFRFYNLVFLLTKKRLNWFVNL